MRGQAFKQRRLTKRDRKILRNNIAGPNLAMEQSMRRGEKIELRTATYHGRNPAYSPVQLPGTHLVRHEKTAKGVPFVRVA